jgi:hypothetical protein
VLTWLASVGRRVARAGLPVKLAVLSVVTLAMLAYGPGALSPVGSMIGRFVSDATTPATCAAAGPAAGTATGLPEARGSATPAQQSELNPSNQALQLAQDQLRAQLTMNRQAVAEAAHPLCRPDR